MLGFQWTREAFSNPTASNPTFALRRCHLRHNAPSGQRQTDYATAPAQDVVICPRLLQAVGRITDSTPI